MDYTYQQLPGAYDRHGIGTLDGYGRDGFAGSWLITRERDLLALPKYLVYRWRN